MSAVEKHKLEEEKCQKKDHKEKENEKLKLKLRKR